MHERLLPVQFLRSLLFMLACLPVFIAWQGSARSLLLSLGAALFILVGFVYLLIGYWLPLSVMTSFLIRSAEISEFSEKFGNLDHAKRFISKKRARF